MAGTGSHKPYLFNADNVARYAPASWHSPGSVIDASYETLDQLARQRAPQSFSAAQTVTFARADCAARPFGRPGEAHQPSALESPLRNEPPADLGSTTVDPALVKGRDVWLVHPWNLGALPALPPDTLVLGLFVGDFHRAWPWSDRRWRFVAARMAELASHRWHGDAAGIGAALAGARRVRSVDEPHLAPWLARWAECVAAPAVFPPVAGRCDSFSQWWTRASRGLQSADDLLAVHNEPAAG